MKAPANWLATAHDHWEGGRRREAIDSVVSLLDAPGQCGPGPYLQLAYYLFVIGDFRTAAKFLSRGAEFHPGNREIALNLGVCQARSGDYPAAVETLVAYHAGGGNDPTALDVLARAYHIVGRDEESIECGARVLQLKDEAVRSKEKAAALEVPADAMGKRRVIAFSLFGNDPRYLRGALQNAGRAAAVYPGWTCRFYVDDSVPADLTAALSQCGSEIVVRDSGEPLHRKLCWRFHVADDRQVGYFLVRDCDSVISHREALAVEEWLASGKPFHAIRDWWGHTDLILAGLWGGVAGLLPPIGEMIAAFRAGKAITANWDQWLLGARVWPLVRESILVHDRFRTGHATRPFPGQAPEGNRHVGQDEFAVRGAEQARKLRRFATSVPSLRLIR